MSTSLSIARVLLVDDHQIVLDSLRLLMAELDRVELVGTVNDPREVLAFVQNNPVDLVICDRHMPHLSGVELTLQLRQYNPAIRVLMLTMAEDGQSIREAVRAGVAGYVLKRTGRSELERAIQTLLDGQRYFSDDVLRELANSPTESHDEKPDPLAHLTDREIDVLRLIALEQTTVEMAHQLGISPATIETHRKNLMQKLGVKNMAGVVKFAVRHGLVP